MVSYFFPGEGVILEDFEAVNRMAEEQISRMDGSKRVEVPPVVDHQRTSFWSSEYVNKYRPSESSTSIPVSSYTPKTYYSSFTSSSASTSDAFYRKMLNAVYKTERKQPLSKVVEKTTRESEPALTTNGSGLSLCGGSSDMPMRTLGAPRESKQPQQMSPDARNQVTAIVLSGVAKMATTMVLNWARDKRVPYELL